MSVTQKVTSEFEIEDFNQLIKEALFEGKDVKIEYVIQEVGADPLDRHAGTPEVVKIKVVEERVFNAKKKPVMRSHDFKDVNNAQDFYDK